MRCGATFDASCSRRTRSAYSGRKRSSLSVQVDRAGLPAWRDVVDPHDDVAQGSFQLAQFAADLRQVHLGVAGPEYGDPTEFFGRTYLTRGLRYLLEQAVQRLNGIGGEPVIDLMTTFGGGKTHSLLAVYHAASGMPADKLPGLREVLDHLGSRATRKGQPRSPRRQRCVCSRKH